MDYIKDFTTVSIASEETSKSFTIKIINDSIIECDEIFKLILNIPASACGAINGATDTTEVTIKDKSKEILVKFIYYYIDQTGAVLSFNQSQYSIEENITPLSVDLMLHVSRETSEDVIVEVTITDGSAKGR